MPSRFSAATKATPLWPSLEWPTALAASSARLRLSGVLMSGLGAPFLTPRPTPALPKGAPVSAATLPWPTSSSISSGPGITMSNASPAAIRRLSTAMTAKSIATLCPVAFSNCGASSSSAARVPGLAMSLSSAALAPKPVLYAVAASDIAAARIRVLVMEPPLPVHRMRIKGVRSTNPRQGTMRRISLLVGIVLGAACGVGTAQDYPTKPIRILVGFSPGSTTDILARTVGQKLSEVWRQPVVIDNRPGAGGVGAANAVATAAADGYTLLVVSAGHAASAAIYAKLPYDTLKDFAGVSRIANVPSILVVSPELGVKSVKDLVALARSKPGQLNFSSPGVGSANHLAAELFKILAGVQAVHVPYKGIPEAMTGVVSGAVQFNFSPVVNILPLSRDGKLVALAASTAKRSAVLPDVPTVAEAGVSGYEFDPWFGLLAPAKTPKTLLARLSGEVARIVELPDVKERLLGLGADPAPASPEGFDAYIGGEVAKFRKIVQEAGIKPE